MISRFHIPERIDGAPCASLLIDREKDMVAVRPYRRRRVYELPLSWVARAVLEHVVLVERREKMALKKRGRK